MANLINSDSQSIPHLPPEIITKILIELHLLPFSPPTMSRILLRNTSLSSCTLVSRQWCTLAQKVLYKDLTIIPIRDPVPNMLGTVSWRLNALFWSIGHGTGYLGGLVESLVIENLNSSLGAGGNAMEFELRPLLMCCRRLKRLELKGLGGKTVPIVIAGLLTDSLRHLTISRSFIIIDLYTSDCDPSPLETLQIHSCIALSHSPSHPPPSLPLTLPHLALSNLRSFTTIHNSYRDPSRFLEAMGNSVVQLDIDAYFCENLEPSSLQSLGSLKDLLIDVDLRKAVLLLSNLAIPNPPLTQLTIYLRPHLVTMGRL